MPISLHDWKPWHRGGYSEETAVVEVVVAIKAVVVVVAEEQQTPAQCSSFIAQTLLLQLFVTY